MKGDMMRRMVIDSYSSEAANSNWNNGNRNNGIRGNDSIFKGFTGATIDTVKRTLTLGATALLGLCLSTPLIAGNGHDNDRDNDRNGGGYSSSCRGGSNGSSNDRDDRDNDRGNDRDDDHGYGRDNDRDNDWNGGYHSGNDWDGRNGEGRNNNNDPMLAPAGNAATSFALHKDGTVWTWGRGDLGQLGTGALQPMSLWPVRVLKGDYQTENSRVTCLGQKSDSRVVDLAGSPGTGIALTKGGDVFTWGSNGCGNLGNGSCWRLGDKMRMAPIAVIKGDYEKDNPRVTYLGEAPNNPIVNVTAGGTLPTDVLRANCMVLAKDGTLYGWGHNNYGELGVGNDTMQMSPRRVFKGEYEKNNSRITYLGEARDNSVAQFGVSEYNVIALTQKGELYTLGRDTYGQLGDGISGPFGSSYPAEHACQNRPVRVLKGEYEQNNSRIKYLGEGDVKIRQISIAGHHCMALMSDGSIYMWGDNRWGLRGDGTAESSSLPKRVLKGEYEPNNSRISYFGQGAVKPVKIRTMCHQTMALMSDGTVYAWGCGDAGQMGNGTQVSAMTPVHVRKGAYYPTSTAITYLGEHRNEPVVDIAGGQDHLVAMTAEGNVYTWGANYSGQLGDGTTTDRSLPTQVVGPDGRGYFNMLREQFIPTKQSVASNDQSGDQMLSQNSPNPFTGSTSISFALPTSGQVTLEMYDVYGRKLMTVLDDQRDAGQYTEQVDMAEYPAGTYYYKLNAGGATAVKSMKLVK